MENINIIYDCKSCEHYKIRDCIWTYDYLDTDYAYDCCDFVKVKCLTQQLKLKPKC